RQQHTDKNADGQIVGGNHYGNGGHHDNIGGKRVFFQGSQRIPGKSPYGHHDHHRRQRGHGDLFDPLAEDNHHHQQKGAGNEGGKAAATAGFYVDNGLADHGAARHAAEQAGADVGNTLAFALAVFIAAGVGEVVNDGGCHHRFQQAHSGEADSIG